MNYRLQTRNIVILVVFVIAAALLFIYTFVYAPTNQDAAEPEASRNELVDSPAPQQIITAKHKYDRGLHTIAGLVSMPTPCDSITVEPFLLGEGNMTAELRFSSVKTGDVCTQVVTDVPFKVTFEAPENAQFQATWNGTPITLNIVPASPEDDMSPTFEPKG